MAVSDRTTRKKSKASSVQPRKPAKTAGPWPSLLGGGVALFFDWIESAGTLKISPFSDGGYYKRFLASLTRLSRILRTWFRLRRALGVNRYESGDRCFLYRDHFVFGASRVHGIRAAG